MSDVWTRCDVLTGGEKLAKTGHTLSMLISGRLVKPCKGRNCRKSLTAQRCTNSSCIKNLSLNISCITLQSLSWLLQGQPHLAFQSKLNIYINDRTDYLGESSIGLCADDTAVQYASDSPVDLAITRRIELGIIGQWLRANKLTLTSRKPSSLFSDRDTIYLRQTISKSVYWGKT